MRARPIAGIAVSLALLASMTAHAQTATADGEVKKVDRAGGKITIRHGPMKALDMDMPMTMVYRVKDPAMLGQLKAGDKVTFDAERMNGQFTVTKIQKKAK